MIDRHVTFCAMGRVIIITHFKSLASQSYQWYYIEESIQTSLLSIQIDKYKKGNEGNTKRNRGEVECVLF